jgi:hypothetical protein
MVEISMRLFNFIQTAKESAFYNKNRLEELRFREYPFPTSKDLIDALVIVHEEILRQLDILEQSASLAESKSEDQALIRIQRYSQALGSLHAVLQILELGEREYVPQGAVVLIKSIMELFDSKSKFILLPNYEYNYCYTELIRPLKNELKDVITDIDNLLRFTNKLAIFLFPLAHRDNAMLNALLAHEVGHFVDDEKQIVESVIKKVTVDQKEIQDTATEWLQTKVASEKREFKIDDFVGMETAKAEMKKEAVTRISNLLKELIADCVAFSLFGPSFLIALNNYLVSLSEIDFESEDHPSARIRLDFLISQFEEMKYFDVLEKDESLLARKFVEVVKEIKASLKKTQAIGEDRVSRLVHEAIYSVKDDLKEEVHTIVGTNEYTAERFHREAFALIDTISSFVPPVEIMPEQPASLVSILNAGMLYELVSMEDMCKMLKNKSAADRLLTRDKLHKLVMKAMELSQIQDLIKETQKKLKGESIL